MKVKLIILFVALATPLHAGGPDAAWRFKAGSSETDGAWCSAEVEGWAPRDVPTRAPRLNVGYGEASLTVGVSAGERVDGLVLAVYKERRPIHRVKLQAVHPSTPREAVVGWFEPADDLVAALGAGDLATIEGPRPERGDPPIFAFSLKGSSGAIGKTLACRK